MLKKNTPNMLLIICLVLTGCVNTKQKTTLPVSAHSQEEVVTLQDQDVIESPELSVASGRYR